MNTLGERLAAVDGAGPNYHPSEIHKVELICPACVGAAGGTATTEAKRAASRRNGAKGGRPPKVRNDTLP